MWFVCSLFNVTCSKVENCAKVENGLYSIQDKGRNSRSYRRSSPSTSYERRTAEAVSSRTSSHSPKRRRSGSADRKGISNPSNIFYNHDMAIDVPDVNYSNDDV